MAERNVLQNADNPFIARLIETLENRDNLFLVMEYCKGGTIRHLLDRIGKISEEQAK